MLLFSLYHTIAHNGPTQVLLFDEVGSTYMCIINEGNEEILEYYRPQCQGDWHIVQRSEISKGEVERARFCL